MIIYVDNLIKYKGYLNPRVLQLKSSRSPSYWPYWIDDLGFLHAVITDLKNGEARPPSAGVRADRPITAFKFYVSLVSVHCYVLLSIRPTTTDLHLR